MVPFGAVKHSLIVWNVNGVSVILYDYGIYLAYYKFRVTHRHIYFCAYGACRYAGNTTYP